MKKRTIILLITLALLIVTATTVLAETATVAITGGTLSFSSDNVSLSGVTLGGSDTTSTSASGSNSWSAVDATGSGAGWNVTIDATDFTDGSSHTLDISDTSQEFKIQLLDNDITVTSGNTKPVSQVTSLTAIPESPAAALKFVSAATDTGMGTYAISPSFELEIPAETYAGSYSSTVTITAVSGP